MNLNHATLTLLFLLTCSPVNAGSQGLGSCSITVIPKTAGPGDLGPKSSGIVVLALEAAMAQVALQILPVDSTPEQRNAMFAAAIVRLIVDVDDEKIGLKNTVVKMLEKEQK